MPPAKSQKPHQDSETDSYSKDSRKVSAVDPLADVAWLRAVDNTTSALIRAAAEAEASKVPAGMPGLPTAQVAADRDEGAAAAPGLSSISVDTAADDPGIDLATGSALASAITDVPALPAPALGPPPPVRLLTEEERAAKLEISAEVSARYGAIIRVLSHTSHYRTQPLSELRWLVDPAIVTGQYLVAEGPLDAANPDGAFGPVAVVTWARLSAELDLQISLNPSMPLRLTAEQWRSGDIGWVLEAAGRPTTVERMIAQLVAETFAGAVVRRRVREADGRISIGTCEPAAG